MKSRPAFARFHGRFAPEGTDFVDRAAHVHVCQAKPPSDDPGTTPENLFDFLRRCIGREVIVFRRPPKNQISYGAADNVGLETCLLEGVDDACRGF